MHGRIEHTDDCAIEREMGTRVDCSICSMCELPVCLVRECGPCCSPDETTCPTCRECCCDCHSDEAPELEIFQEVRAFALRDIHRLNAKSADVYAFTLDADGKSWSGGWDWSRALVDKDAQYLLILATGKIIKNR